jgi:hypothetical protein
VSLRELFENIDQLRINGKGHLTPVADAPTCVEIIWELPGKAAKAFRRQCAHLICRILGADRTLIEEIEVRYNRTPQSVKDIMTAHVERPVLPEQSIEELKMTRKRKILDLEEQEENIKRMRTENEILALKNKESTYNFYKTIKQERPHDLPWMTACEDGMRNVIIPISTILYTNPYCADISTVLRERKTKYDQKTLVKIGMHLSKQHLLNFGCAPHKVGQKWVNGSLRKVNVYEKHKEDWYIGEVNSYLQAID